MCISTTDITIIYNKFTNKNQDIDTIYQASLQEVVSWLISRKHKQDQAYLDRSDVVRHDRDLRTYNLQ